MATGGTITVKNPQGVTLSVTVTGSGSFTKSGGGSASFPESITGDESFTTTSDGDFTLSIKYRGREVAAAPDATLAVTLRAGCQLIISPSPDAGFTQEPGSLATTTTALNAIGNAVNTTGKYEGKVLFNTTTSKLVVATGGAAGDTWKSCDAVTTYTPA